MMSFALSCCLLLLASVPCQSSYTQQQHMDLGAKLGRITVGTAAARAEAMLSGKGTLCQGDNDCCTEDNQCGLGEGDCDSDADCLGELVCSSDSCSDIYKMLHSQNPDDIKQIDVSKFSGSDDCCFYDKELADYAKYISSLE